MVFRFLYSNLPRIMTEVRGALDEDMKVPKVVLDLVRVVSLFFAYVSARTHGKYGISGSDWVGPTRPAVRLKSRT